MKLFIGGAFSYPCDLSLSVTLTNKPQKKARRAFFKDIRGHT